MIHLCVCGHRRWEHVMVHRDRARPCNHRDSGRDCGCAAYRPRPAAAAHIHKEARS